MFEFSRGFFEVNKCADFTEIDNHDSNLKIQVFWHPNLKHINNYLGDVDQKSMFNTNQALVQLRVELDGRSDIVWSNPMVNSPYACIPLRYFVNDFLTTKLLRGLRDYFFLSYGWFVNFHSHI